MQEQGGQSEEALQARAPEDEQRRRFGQPLAVVQADGAHSREFAASKDRYR